MAVAIRGRDIHFHATGVWWQRSGDKVKKGIQLFIESAIELFRIDPRKFIQKAFSVRCYVCNDVDAIPMLWGRDAAANYLSERGWRIRLTGEDPICLCPKCAKRKPVVVPLV